MVSHQHEPAGIPQRAQAGRKCDLRRLVYDANIKGTSEAREKNITNKSKSKHKMLISIY